MRTVEAMNEMATEISNPRPHAKEDSLRDGRKTKLDSMGVKIHALSAKQEAYLSPWQEGT